MDAVRLAVGVGVLAAAVGSGVAMTGNPALFIDPAAAVWIAAVLAGGLWLAFGPVVVGRAVAAALLPGAATAADAALAVVVLARAHLLAWGAGLLGLLVGLVTLLQNMDDPSKIGPGMGAALVVVLYGGGVAELVIGPLQGAAAARVTVAPGATTPTQTRAAAILGIAFAMVFMVVAVFALFALATLPA